MKEPARRRSDGPVAIFGGPYSNLEATHAFLNAAARLDIPPTRIVCTGDVVAYGADAAATAALVRDSGCHVIMGNCEENLAAGAADCGCGFEEGSACDRLSASWFAHATAQLSTDARAWMASLPRRIDLEIGGYRFAVVHGSVDQINQFIFASTDAAIKQHELDKAGLDGVIGGHCGLPFTQMVGARLWHNSGAIGMPANDGTPRVWYSILYPERDGIAIEHRALAYDHTQAAAKMRRAGLPEEYAAALGSGLWASVDALPAQERFASGVALEEGRLVWRPDVPERAHDRPLDCQRLWPAVAAHRVHERV
jgi:predicted phosphodiesterase